MEEIQKEAGAIPSTELPKAAPRWPLKKFLESAAAFETHPVDTDSMVSRSGGFKLEFPEISIYCGYEDCDGVRFFDSTGSAAFFSAHADEFKNLFVEYLCRHCKKTTKVFALAAETRLVGGPSFRMMKYGENPPAIGPSPKALKDLLGDQWSMYIKGRRSELAGLGIGAFIYYRRVVEHVWQNVLARLLQVAKLEGSTDRTAALAAAQSESRFTRSMDTAKASVPVSLFVDGHNPLQLLYDACGDGVHEYTDAECLQRSNVIRIVLGRFSERARLVLAEDAELRVAVGSLANAGGQGQSPKA
jgi:hypothetical protein